MKLDKKPKPPKPPHCGEPDAESLWKRILDYLHSLGFWSLIFIVSLKNIIK